jgi:hypothetical protein
MKLDFETDLKLPIHFWKIVLLIVGCALGWNKSSILLIMGV